MCTLLDAHHDVAMSYELYPNLLETDVNIDLTRVSKAIRKAWGSRALAACMPTPRFNTFVNRCDRGGLSKGEVAQLFERLAEEGHHTSQLEGRLRMVELCGLTKMNKVKKKRWGMKCNNSYDDYLSYWPTATFLNMVRDGRDVLASQLNTGNFKNSPSDLGRSWANTHLAFDRLVQSEGVSAKFVFYEKLTANPGTELQNICEFLSLDFAPSMLAHHEQDLTVFNAQHLSHARITQSIDTSMIGRWREDLTPQQVEEFVAAAGDSLKSFGYV